MRLAIYSIIAVMLACPAAAFAKADPAPRKTEEKATAFNYKALTNEAAERVKAKALFHAEIIPALQRVIDKNAERRSYGPSANEIAEELWLLRTAPETQKAMFNAILAAQDPQDLREKINELKQLIDSTTRIASSLLQKKEHALREERQEKREQMSEREYRLYSMTEKLEEEKRWATAMGNAVGVAAVIKETGLRFYEVEKYLEPLGKLKGNPEVVKAAATLIKQRNIPDRQVSDLLEKLAVSPKEALADIDNIDELNRINARFRFAMNTESEQDIIKMPVASVLPKAAEELGKVKTIPLAASTFKRTGNLLQTRRLEKVLLIDTEHGLPLRSDKEGENDHLVFLNPGERLYMVGANVGSLIPANTPLGTAASYGLQVAVYGEDTRRSFERFFVKKSRADLRPVYLIAAACEPEELRKHLASLMVVRAEREKSLYGPFADFEWKKEDNPYSARELADFPMDSPGQALRFADIRDADLFLVLAPLADKEGLERLMGPIRGIWVQNRFHDKTPWVELRYTPDGKTKSSELGKAPILELNKAALESIVATKRSVLEYLWASYVVQEEAINAADKKNRRDVNPDYVGKLPEALKSITARFDEMAAKGFVSPWDMGSATYYLYYAGKDTAVVEILKAIRDDVSQSSAKRMRAMRSALKER